MREKIIYRADRYGEIPTISQLMASVFNEFIAPGYDSHGTDEFLHYIEPTAIACRIKRNHFFRVAEIKGEIVGVVEMRDFHHISLLFVAGKYQRQGIASELVRQAIAISATSEPTMKIISVHADPRALLAYQAMGFQAIGRERVKNGIRYIPMHYDLTQKPLLPINHDV